MEALVVFGGLLLLATAAVLATRDGTPAQRRAFFSGTIIFVAFVAVGLLFDFQGAGIVAVVIVAPLTLAFVVKRNVSVGPKSETDRERNGR